MQEFWGGNWGHIIVLIIINRMTNCGYCTKAIHQKHAISMGNCADESTIWGKCMATGEFHKAKLSAI